MIFDAQNLFSKNQAVTATALSDGAVDLGFGDIGPSERLSLVVCASGFTAGSLDVELHTAEEAADDGTLVSPTAVACYPVSAEALASGGCVVATRLPHGVKRYVRLNYVAGETAPTGGAITAGLVLDAQTGTAGNA